MVWLTIETIDGVHFWYHIMENLGIKSAISDSSKLFTIIRSELEDIFASNVNDTLHTENEK